VLLSPTKAGFYNILAIFEVSGGSYGVIALPFIFSHKNEELSTQYQHTGQL
jgi:hypothetical protein